MAKLSAKDAIAQIKPGASLDELRALASQVSAAPAGPDVILYSAVSEEAKRNCQDGTGYALIDDTERAALLSSDDFLFAVAQAAGISETNPKRAIDNLMKGSRLPDGHPDKAAATIGNAAMFGVEADAAALQNSFWGLASREFAEGASGHVVLLLGRPVQKVFWAVELPALQAACAAGKLPGSTINGIPIASLPPSPNVALSTLWPSAEARAKVFTPPAPASPSAPGGGGGGGSGGGGGGGAGRPAARILDPVIHPLPGMLQPGPGSFNVIIGSKPAWRGVPAAAAAAIQSAKATSDAAITTAEAATVAAAPTPGAAAAKTAEEGVKATAATTMGSTITSAAGGADIHACLTPLPIPPHGPGVVIDGSQTVLVNGLPLCRMGDTIIEAVGPPNKIAMGEPTVLIGG
ncbi:PAAR domain-containing protein [Bosea vestrisii]|jgi:uncharacterized Zn-binding protein involved in type VI secretion|uniref:PAAR domain-containing protein n=1 Tax=Bosea vestrisii TaxID=151416 RepID=A0ABW0HI90_9HYPH